MRTNISVMLAIVIYCAEKQISQKTASALEDSKNCIGTEKTTYRYQNVGKNCNVKTTNKYSENSETSNIWKLQ
jgi:hypothetical protein